MPVNKVKLKSGIRYRFDKKIRNRRLTSPYIYLTKEEAVKAEAETLTRFLMSGTPNLPPSLPDWKVKKFLAGRVRWLRDHRAIRYADETEGLFRRGLAYVQDWDNMPVEAITADMVEGWADKWAMDLVERNKTRDEVNKGLTAFQAAWNHPWGRRRGKRTYPNNPFSEIERMTVDHRAKVIPSDKEVNAVLLATKGEARLFLEILRATGARQGEARALAWKDFNSDRPALDLYTRKKKGGILTPRRIVIDKKISSQLKAWRKKHLKSIYLFQQSGDPLPRTERWSLNLQIEACTRAGVKYFPLHSWRHYYASKLMEAGLTLPQIQARLGHESISTTDRYIHELMGV
jgi:integrase